MTPARVETRECMFIHRSLRRKANCGCKDTLTPLLNVGMRLLQLAVWFTLLSYLPTPPASANPGVGITSATHPRETYSWPVAPPTITRHFNQLEHNWQSGHRGVDLAASPGTVILSAADGVVHFAGKVNHQLSVSILHSDGIRTTYGPLEETPLQKGHRIRRGDPVGTLALPTAQHPEQGVHWGAIRGSTYLNPLDLVSTRPIVLKPTRGSATRPNRT